MRSVRGDEAGAELLFVFGASAITDRRDVIPAGIERAGGHSAAFRHAGRPRQSAAAGQPERQAGGRPSKLRALAQGERLRFRAPARVRRPAGWRARTSCAWAWAVCCRKSPAVRSRAMPSTRLCARRASPRSCWRPVCRRAWDRTSCWPNGAANRCVRWTVESALASEAKPVIVVTGHESAKVEAVLKGLDVRFVHNLHYATGLERILEGRHPRRARQLRRRDRASRRHARDRRVADRPHDRGVLAARRPLHLRRRPRAPARQSRPVGAALLLRRSKRSMAMSAPGAHRRA